ESKLEVLNNAALHFYLEDSTLSYPKPYMPDTISVGDLIVGYPLNPLPEEFDKFMEKSKTVLISFGSYIDYLDVLIYKKFCTAIKMLPDVKFIWRSKNSKVCGDILSNVLFRSWIPQNDLLADSRLNLFITHGGYNSLMESVYHATPVIVFPLMGDQVNMASVAVGKTYGLEMDLGNWEAEELVKNIKQVMEN
ncbi:hypothetical protein HELRODRAFT_144002, partial [Helobdella robusta]|uniref:UDP-glucuronosyltransferase n=1 Tax=Helobdella robusta TaxID=6412 RepID=T1EJD3_HELRO